MSLTTQVESLLFALGRRSTVEELARILKVRDQDKVVEALRELKAAYDAKEGPLIVIEQDGGWKMTVHDEHLPLVRRVVSKTELPKGVMETLAVIAYKTPVLQSHIVKVRTTKAYDHLAALQQEGFITREKSGRTKLIKLGKKFFDYFDIPADKIKERFGTVHALEQAIIEKEDAMTAAAEQHTVQSAAAKKEEEEYKTLLTAQHRQIDEEISKLPEIDLVDDEGHAEKLESYTSSVVDVPEKPALDPSIEMVNEPEIFKQHRGPKKTSKKSALGPDQNPLDAELEASTPRIVEEEAPAEPTTEEVIEKLANAPAEEAPVIKNKFEPASVEQQAHQVAATLESHEGKGLFTGSSSTPEIEKTIDEKAAAMTRRPKKEELFESRSADETKKE